jgi:hypothetical protein
VGRTVGPLRTLVLQANLSPCAHTCRYCSIGERSGRLALDRWMATVEKYLEWKRANNLDVEVVPGFLPSYNFDPGEFAQLSGWFERRLGARLEMIPLGGLRIRSGGEMSSWLSERRALGLERVWASFAGYQAVHDRWNGRAGDFAFLVSTLERAAAVGLKHGTTVFLTKSSLDDLGRLLVLIDALPGESAGRDFRQFYYIGHAAHHENERLDEGDRQRLPEFVLECYLAEGWELRSEREWLETVGDIPSEPTPLTLRLDLDSRNIVMIEDKSCDEVVGELERRARKTLASLPGTDELASLYGDESSTKLYPQALDLERLWIDRHLDVYPEPLDRALLHYHLGRSAKPPRLATVAPSDESSGSTRRG